MEDIHDPRCSYWVDEICVCPQIAELEEQAEWVGRGYGSPGPYYGVFDTFYGYGTMTAAPYVTTTMTMPPSWRPGSGGW